MFHKEMEYAKAYQEYLMACAAHGPGKIKDRPRAVEFCIEDDRANEIRKVVVEYLTLTGQILR